MISRSNKVLLLIPCRNLERAAIVTYKIITDGGSSSLGLPFCDVLRSPRISNGRAIDACFVQRPRFYRWCGVVFPSMTSTHRFR